jgi:TolB-like protein/class 3 adenylate cyclase/Tfp pilus assembly protein PilF
MKDGLRKLAAILFTDIVGYSSRAEADERLTLELLEEHRRLVRPILQRHNGREIKTMGDAFMVKFSSAVDAVQCALELQERLRRRNLKEPPERQVLVRAGIHLGDVVHEDNDLFGEGVNIASRIVPLAEPGGVVLTEAVRAQVHNKLPYPVVPLGPTKLRNLKMPADLYRIVFPWSEAEAPLRGWRRWLRAPVLFPAALAIGLAAAAAVLWLRDRAPAAEPPTAPAAAVRSIAVLPLADFSARHDAAYFADGMTEALITDLARIRALKVISRTSVMRYKGTGKSLPQIARELGVEAVIEGSVTRDGRRVRIAAKLLDARTDRTLWAESYERNTRDILALQREVARAIAQAVQVRLTPQEEASLGPARPVDPAAHDAFLQGLYHWNRRTRPDLEESVRLFGEAAGRDPGYAAAYAGLAGARIVMADWGYEEPAAAYAEVRVLAEKAVGLDPLLAEGRTAKAAWHIHRWEWKAAEGEFRRALEINPGYATAHQWYAELLVNLGRFPEAVTHARTACDLDPLSLIAQTILGVTYYQSRQTELAIPQLEQTLAMDPAFFLARRTLWFCHIQKDDPRRAADAYRRILEETGADPGTLAAFDAAYAGHGLRGVWRWLVEQGIALVPQPYSRPYYYATYHALLGEKARALDWLEKAQAVRSSSLASVATDPVFDALRDEPRFRALLKAMGLEGVGR